MSARSFVYAYLSIIDNTSFLKQYNCDAATAVHILHSIEEVGFLRVPGVHFFIYYCTAYGFSTLFISSMLVELELWVFMNVCTYNIFERGPASRGKNHKDAAAAPTSLGAIADDNERVRSIRRGRPAWFYLYTK
uniref:Uncharacterized protein n=1 Tax=Trichogramma kaykai TaxID=54128 RepID=A0ABD2X8Y8_9HYME